MIYCWRWNMDPTNGYSVSRLDLVVDQGLFWNNLIHINQSFNLCMSLLFHNRLLTKDNFLSSDIINVDSMTYLGGFGKIGSARHLVFYINFFVLFGMMCI
jgi:hypothetical protein